MHEKSVAPIQSILKPNNDPMNEQTIIFIFQDATAPLWPNEVQCQLL